MEPVGGALLEQAQAELEAERQRVAEAKPARGPHGSKVDQKQSFYKTGLRKESSVRSSDT